MAKGTIVNDLAEQAHSLFKSFPPHRLESKKIQILRSDVAELIGELGLFYKTIEEQRAAVDTLLSGRAKFMGFAVDVIDA